MGKKIRLWNRERRATCHSVGISGGNACVNIGDDVIVEDETVEEESESINAASNSGDLVTEGTDITTACDNHACSDHASYPACTCVGCSDFNKPNQPTEVLQTKGAISYSGKTKQYCRTIQRSWYKV